MTRINTNVSSLTAQKTLARSNNSLQEALTRLSTGLRINKGKDDPAGLIASEVLRSDIISVQKAISNSERANQLIATADSALGQVSSLLNDIRGLVSESANVGALSDEQIAANQLQVDSSLEAIDRIAQTTSFQGSRLLDGSLDFLTTAAGANTAARGTFGAAVDARAVGTLGTKVDARATGGFGSVTTDARAVGSFGAVETDKRGVGSFGTDVDAKARITVGSATSGASVLFTAQESGFAGNDYAITFTAGGAAGTVGVAFDGTAKTLQFSVTSTTTSADIVSALQATPSAYLALSASVVSNGVVTAGATGTTVSGSSSNNILLSANLVGAAFNDTDVVFTVTTVATGSETAQYNTATNKLNVFVNTASTTSVVISAINATGAFAATTTGEGLGRYASGTFSTVTTGGSANNKIVLSAATLGPQFNNATIVLATGAATGSETAAYNTAANTLTVTIHDQTTTAQVISAINTNGVFTASTKGAGLGRYAAASFSAVTSGGSANNRVVLEASTFGARFNDTAVVIASGAALGSETASYNTASNILTVTVNSASTTANLVNAINTNGTFRASTTGAGLGTYSDGAILNVTTGGSANNKVILSATSSGGAFNNTDVIFKTGANTGSETATYNTATNTLTVTLHDNSTAAQVVSAVTTNGTFTASLEAGSSGLGRFTAGTFSDVTSGGSFNNKVILSATNGGAQYNNASLVIATGANIGSETAAYDTGSNTLTVTINNSSTSNQVAKAINSNGVFAASLASGASGQGTFVAGTTAGVTRGAGSGSVTDLKIDQANFGTTSSIGVNIQVDKQATKGNLTYSGGALASDTTIEVGGQNGFEVFNFGAGTTTSQIADALNLVSDATGVTAKVDDTNGELTLSSREYGSAAVVSIRGIKGSFATVNDAGVASSRTSGSDVALRINGIQANGKGRQATLNTSTLDISFNVKEEILDGAEFSFDITGGGAVFQLGPDVVSNQQARIGIQGVSTATLGGVSGSLYELRSGGVKSLATDPKAAAAVVDEVISSVTQLRGRLGAFQRTTLETNIATLNDGLENLSEAESSIRDADFAVESAKLTRAQILVQSGTSVLGIANQNPQNVLSLLR